MKVFIVLIILIFSTGYAYAQKAKSKPIKKDIFVLKVLKIITIGNQDEYYNSKLFLSNEISKDSITLLNSDTLKKLFDKLEFNKFELRNLIIRIQTSRKSYYYSIGKIKDFHNVDTIIYVINYDTLSIKKLEEEEIVKEAELEIKWKEDLKFIENIFNDMVNEAEEKVNYYKNRIDNKNRNKIADFLYDEGFSRDITTSGSVIKEIYTIRFVYDNISESDKSFKIIIALWNSYGYGKAFYSIEYEIYLLGRWYYWRNGKWNSI